MSVHSSPAMPASEPPASFSFETVLELPSEKLHNDGTVGEIEEWGFETVQINSTLAAVRLEGATLDGMSALGLDNVRVITRQKCVTKR